MDVQAGQPVERHSRQLREAKDSDKGVVLIAGPWMLEDNYDEVMEVRHLTWLYRELHFCCPLG